MRFCRATGRLYVAFRSGGVWTLDPSTGAEHRRRPLDYRIGYNSPALSADGRTVVFRRASYINSQSENTIVGHTVTDDGALVEVWSRPDTGTVNGAARFDFTLNPRTGHLFGPAGVWGGARAFEWTVPETGALVGSFALAPGASPIAQWVLAPDGARVAWLAGHALYVQELDGAAPQVLPAAGQYRRGLAWAPDGRTLAYTTGTTVRLLDADTLAEVRALDWGTGKARAVAFSPDGLRAAVSAEGGKDWVTVFDLE